MADIEKNSEELEDDFYLYKKVPEDVYIRLRTKLAKEKADIMEILSTLDVESSISQYCSMVITSVNVIGRYSCYADSFKFLHFFMRAQY